MPKNNGPKRAGAPFWKKPETGRPPKEPRSSGSEPSGGPFAALRPLKGKLKKDELDPLKTVEPPIAPQDDDDEATDAESEEFAMAFEEMSKSKPLSQKYSPPDSSPGNNPFAALKPLRGKLRKGKRQALRACGSSQSSKEGIAAPPDKKPGFFEAAFGKRLKSDSGSVPDFNPFGPLGPLREKLLKDERAQREALSRAKLAPMAPPKVETDDILWGLATAEVERLKNDHSIFRPEPKPATSWKNLAPARDDFEVIRNLSDLVAGRVVFDLSSTDEYIEGKVKGFPQSSMERLRLGRIPYQDHLDLHGQTLAQAEISIFEFIKKSVALGRFCILLIHGRGLGSPGGVSVIKRNLESLLLHSKITKNILAFTTAQPVDGGLGASYVLLRTPSPGRKR